MKVLIADDEKMIRHGIAHGIDWPSLGISEVLEARNGQEALAVFLEERPEILLTDIRMPLMDGVELVREIRKTAAETQVVYITGFSDVEYLRSAVRNSAVDYILKPVETQELLTALRKAASRCQKRERAEKELLEMERKVLQSTPLLTRQLILRVLHSDYAFEAQVRERISFLKLPIDVESLFLVSLFAVREGRERPLKYDDELFAAGLENIGAEVLSRLSPSYVISLGNLEFAAVTMLREEAEPHLRKHFASLQAAVKQYFSADCQVVLGPVVEGFFNIQESYAYARQGLRQSFRFPADAILSYDQCGQTEEEVFFLQKEALSRVASALAEGELSQAREEVEALLNQAANTLTTADEMFGLCLMLSSEIFLHFCGEAMSREEMDFFLEYIQRLRGCRLSLEMKTSVDAFLLELRARQSRRPRSKRAQVTEELKALIQQNLCRNLSIRELSSKVFLAPTYLCSLFKEETGETINTYMTREKMRYAKELLRTGNPRVYEVSGALGYQDVKYFSRMFRRTFDMTPTEYMEKAGK